MSELDSIKESPGPRLCGFEGCERKHFGRGYCHAHYCQLRRGAPLTPIQKRKPIAPKGQAYCSKCKTFQPEENFGRDTQRKQPKRLCRICQLEVQKAYQQRTIRVTIDDEQRYIAREVYDTMFQAQDGQCAICRRRESQKRRFDLDHCHTTGRYRGLLCNRCNVALGLLGDSPEIMERAALYVRNGGVLEEQPSL